MEQREDFIAAAAHIVVAYVSKNPISAPELPGLIKQTFAALAAVGEIPVEPPSEPQTPAVPIKKSVTRDHIVCLEDGKTFKALNRHLRTDHNLTPQEYRAKWGLPQDYPMTAPSYSEARSNLAREIGLGQKGRKASA